MSNTSVDQRVDYISNLPDELVCRILALLPTKYSVRTSILSKRWRYVWSQVPAIDFSDLDLSHSRYPLLNDEQALRFNNFMTDWVLHGMDVSYLVRCMIPLHYNDDPLQIKSWLDAIKLRKMGELDMRYKENNGPILLPREFLSCQGLRVVKLECFRINDTPTSFNLPKLETVHFGYGTVFPDDLFLKRFLSGCPIVKELHIHSVKGLHNTLYVESLTLRSLDVRYINSIHCTSIDIYAPNLRYLSLKNVVVKYYNIGDMDFLSDANIEITHAVERHCFKHSTLLELIKKVSRVRSLEFVTSMFNLGSSFRGELPTFENLTHMTLFGDGCLYDLLNHAPNLKSVFLKQIVIHAHNLFEGKVVPQCFSCLEIVELLLEPNPFVFKKEKHYLLKVAEYILKAATALKEMTVKIRNCGTSSSDLLACLLKFPCSSPRCKFKVVRIGGAWLT